MPSKPTVSKDMPGYCNRCWECGKFVEGGMCTQKHPNYNHDRAIELGYVVEKSGEL